MVTRWSIRLGLLWLSACGGGSSDSGSASTPAGGVAASSSVATSSITVSTLAAPASLTAINPTSQTITLNWSASTGALGYKVYRNGVLVWTSPPSVSAPAASTATTYVDSGLSPNATYTDAVTAYNELTESAPSAGVTRNTTVAEPAGARVGYRFPTNALRWTEFGESPDSSFAFPIYDADPVNGYDLYRSGNISPFIAPALASAHAQNRGLKVLGHITGGNTPVGGIAAFKAKVDTWYQSFPQIDGIYVGDAGYAGPVGDASARRAFIEYWAEAASYIHAHGGLAVIHGGLPNGAESPASTADLNDNNRQLLHYFESIVIYETFWTESPNPVLSDWVIHNLPGDSYSYNFRFRYEVFANAVSGALLPVVVQNFLSQGVGYVYATAVDQSRAVNDGSLDPRDTPAYWSCERALLQINPSPPCSGLP